MVTLLLLQLCSHTLTRLQLVRVRLTTSLTSSLLHTQLNKWTYKSQKLRDYLVDRAAINANNESGGQDPYAPYGNLLKEKTNSNQYQVTRSINGFLPGRLVKKTVDDVEGAFGVSNARQSFRTNVPKAACSYCQHPREQRQPASVARPLSTQEKADFTYGGGYLTGNRFGTWWTQTQKRTASGDRHSLALTESYQQEQQRKT